MIDGGSAAFATGHWLSRQPSEASRRTYLYLACMHKHEAVRAEIAPQPISMGDVVPKWKQCGRLSVMQALCPAPTNSPQRTVPVQCCSPSAPCTPPCGSGVVIDNLRPLIR